MTFQLPDGLPSPIKPAFIPKYEVEKQLSSEFSTSRSGSLEPLINEHAIRDTVPDAQVLIEEAQTFETTAESLQGIENGFNRDYFWQQSIVGVQEIPPEPIEVKAAAPEPRETPREDWLIDENNPEPVSEPVINFSTDVAGIPDERVQWRATLVV